MLIHILCNFTKDEAKKNKIYVDLEKLSTYLDVDVVPISAREKIGIDNLLDSLKRNEYFCLVYIMKNINIKLKNFRIGEKQFIIKISRYLS